MEDALSSYRKRQYLVQKRHARLARGYKTKIDRNGNFVQVPDNKVSRPAFRVLILSAVAFTAFKTFLLVALGAEAYSGHLAALEGGTQYEQVGAWLMQIDPVTAKLAEFAALFTA